MKISELAKELNVSVQTIYRTLNAVKQSETECLTAKANNITHLTPYGEEIIRKRLTGVKHDVKQKDPICLTESNDVKHHEADEISYLRNQNAELLEQLKYERAELDREREHSRAQAERLAALAENLAELTRNSQILQAKDRTVLLPDGESPTQAEAQPIKKKGFWSLFRKN